MAASAPDKQPAEVIIGNAVLPRSVMTQSRYVDGSYPPCCFLPVKQYLDEPLRSKFLEQLYRVCPDVMGIRAEPLLYLPVHGVPGEERPKRVVLIKEDGTLSVKTPKLLETRAAWGDNCASLFMTTFEVMG